MKLLFNKPASSPNTAKKPPFKKMTEDELWNGRVSAHNVITGETVAPQNIPKKLLTFPKKQEVAKSPIPVEVADKILETEQAWVLCRDYTNRHTKFTKELTALLNEHGISEHAELLSLVTFDNKPVTVSFKTYEEDNAPKAVLDKDKLKKEVSEEIYNKCCEPTIGLIREHAGEAVLKKCTVITHTAGKSRIIEQARV